MARRIQPALSEIGDAARALRQGKLVAFPTETVYGLGGDATSDRAVAAIFTALEGAGAKIERHRDPAVLPKAIKNETELTGTRAAHVRDGVAVSRFLKWMEAVAPQGGLDELGAAAKLREFRDASGVLKDLSFDTISAAGPNGALPHFKVDETTNTKIRVTFGAIARIVGDEPSGEKPA